MGLPIDGDEIPFLHDLIGNDLGVMTLISRDQRIGNFHSLVSLTHKLYREMDKVSPKARTFPK